MADESNPATERLKLSIKVTTAHMADRPPSNIHVVTQTGPPPFRKIDIPEERHVENNGNN
jgi:hypothetical protein